jgi:threonine/homoserine/homoserine lactone efflux protein
MKIKNVGIKGFFLLALMAVALLTSVFAFNSVQLHIFGVIIGILNILGMGYLAYLHYQTFQNDRN